MPTRARHLVLVLGDQLTHDNPAFEDFDPARDRVALIEAPGEATHVWSHKARIVLFLSAMRHFADELRARGWPVDYVALDAPGPPALADRLAELVRQRGIGTVLACEPGEWRLARQLDTALARAGARLELREDTHFLCSSAQFAQWAGQRDTLRMEFFYRRLRQRLGVLVDGDGRPEGGRWNFDVHNRGAYPRSGPGEIQEPANFAPDAITREVIALVERQFPAHPGRLDRFRWPVTRAQALQALQRFTEARLPGFGAYQDAMWTGVPFGWHALLSSSLNLKLLDPREVIAAAESAWRERGLELAGVEGFIRQVLGWREFVRGVYWLDMPGLAQANHYGHLRSLARWYWTGNTEMACMRAAVGQTLEYGYAHHIQRLMLTGQFALLAEVDPRQVCDWYLAAYVDAVEWAELPNTAGMALFANGGRFTSKPYIASGQYVRRMSNYCSQCRYDPSQRTGDDACPMTTLYWHFLTRHSAALAANPRTALMARNVARLGAEQRRQLGARANRGLERIDQV
ncbi:MAG: cryptochrome/photolyase family protein [Burkholderiales bacterium]|nr:MAG: cryptochrome/photolyase family protein [Burkholderiales bacterium]